MKALFAISLSALALAGCVSTHSNGVYAARQTQNEQIVRMATVESTREVTIAERDSGTGTMAGAALGGIAGSNVGGGNGSAAGAIVGALAGGVLGHNLEANANMRKGLEITVRLDDGQLRAITQDADEAFHPGERVRLLSSGRTTRVTH